MNGLRGGLRDFAQFASKLFARQGALEAKVDQILLELDFMKTRMASYLGNGRALTYLDDHTPIFVNSNDFGPPSNMINGGLYEPDNLEVIFSFINAGSIFLDIGANVGFFSLKVASRLRMGGSVHAFEPHPELAALLRGSAHLNGVGGLNGGGTTLSVHEVAVGDANKMAAFLFPVGHLGGGTQTFDVQNAVLEAPMRRLDDFFGPEFTFDVAKIDVEGHELAALQGMRSALERSTRAVIIFEKHGPNRGDEEKIERFFDEFGFAIFHIGANAQLTRLDKEELSRRSGDFVAARPRVIRDELDRRVFYIHNAQLRYPHCVKSEGVEVVISGVPGTILFHGPYWHLRKGVYRVTLFGTLNSSLTITFAHYFGRAFAKTTFSPSEMTREIVIDRDMVHFECVGSVTASCEIRLLSIKFHRIG